MPYSDHQDYDLADKKRTKNKAEFIQMRLRFPDRITIVSEGDSWFAYPKKWLIAGKPSNLIDHISKWTHKKANFLTMASNGDEAVDIISGKQKHDLVKILRWHHNGKNRKPVDLLLFSGGGNDVVGENDFERFINRYDESYVTGKQYINMPRLERKIKQIGLAYQELLDIRDHYSPKTLIMTHTYDYPYPSLTGGVFLGGLIQTEAWMKRFMDAAGIQEEFQADVIQVFMDTMAKEILDIETRRKGFIVVDSRKTLVGATEWLNEIHPTSEGFKKIAEQIFKKMKNFFPTLG
ncbi:MAG: SGNH/GDSL hydrolase family protein [Desulfobacteraceae bacterium]|nr:SGNH/GDSL hydrolase family protein [Desulfobacteraceae bacterium]